MNGFLISRYCLMWFTVSMNTNTYTIRDIQTDTFYSYQDRDFSFTAIDESNVKIKPDTPHDWCIIYFLCRYYPVITEKHEEEEPTT